jgi:hypothetical protein
MAMPFRMGNEFTVIAHDFKHNIRSRLSAAGQDHSMSDRRRILTMEMAITALAAVRSITITACLMIVVYIWLEFDYVYGSTKKGFGLQKRIC